MSLTGFVLIGRNEGQRLVRCLASVARTQCPMVYVDSGSTDGSPQRAAEAGAIVISLDMSVPFTAARARNEGWRRLQTNFPDLSYIHFVDGDCELVDGWLAVAEQSMHANADWGVVCGRLRERFPDASVFNLMCDIEWNTPVGAIRSCGGVALIRLAAIVAVDGYRDDLIAGEEPEMCARLRAQRWGVQRIAADMAWHDAAITRWSQWWRRTKRTGHAYAEGASLHGAPPERLGVAQARRAMIWGLALPVGALVSFAVDPMIGIALLLAYPLQVARLALRPEPAARESGAVWRRAFFLVMGRFPEAAGVMLYHYRFALNRRRTLIEYK